MKAQNYTNISCPLIYLKCSTISIKIPTEFFMNIDKLILKFIWRSKRIRIAKILLRKKSKGCASLDIKVYCKAVMIKSVWNWHRD